MEKELKHGIVQHRHSLGQNRTRAVISTIFAFLLSLILITVTALLVIRWSCFARSSFYENMASNNYYNYVKSDFYDNAEASLMSTGLTSDVLRGIVDLLSVHKDVNGYIDAAFHGKTYKADTTDLKSKLEKNIRSFLAQKKIVPNAEQEENITYYVNEIAGQYVNTVQMPLLSYFMKARMLYNRIFLPALAGALIIMLFLIILIIRLHHWFHRGLRYIVYSTLACTLMSAIVPIVILQSGFYRRIHLAPEYFYNFAMTYLSNIFKTFVKFGISWGIVSVMLMLMIKIIKSNMGSKES